MKKKIALLLAMVIMINCVCINAEAAVNSEGESYMENGDIVVDGPDVGIMPCWLYTAYILQDLRIATSGRAVCAAILVGYEEDVAKISAHLYLERKMNKSTYRVEESWHETASDFNLSTEKVAYLTKKGTYRLHVEYYIYDKNNRCEMITMYTDDRVY